MNQTLARPSPRSAAALNALFARTARASDNVIVPVNDRALDGRAGGPAFYCVHSLSGTGGTDFLDLARLMPDVRFYGIQAPPARMKETGFGSAVAPLAAYYAAALTDFQPEGPFLVGGWSAGATIALEIAQNLRARGREVQLLVPIDAAPENAAGGLPSWHPLYLLTLLANVPAWIIHEVRESSFRAMARRVSGKLAGLRRGLLPRSSESPSSSGRYAVEDFLDLSRYPPYHRAFIARLYNALFAYRPQEYGGDVIVYEATVKPLLHLPQVGKVWRSLAPRAKVARIGGTHLSIVRKRHVGALADDLRRRIDETCRPAATEPGAGAGGRTAAA